MERFELFGRGGGVMRLLEPAFFARLGQHLIAPR